MNVNENTPIEEKSKEIQALASQCISELEQLRVWYAPEDMKGGRKLHEEIFSAIQIHDKLLLVLSENSMKSEWVMTEIRERGELKERRVGGNCSRFV